MNQVACNLCGSDDFSVVFKAGEAQLNQVVKCNRCGLMYANPRGQEVDVVQIKGYDPQFVLEKLTLGANHWRLEKEELQVRDYADTRKFVGKMFPNRGTLLEVGSGLGYLLNYFRQDGWTTRGVEPNAGLCRYAETTLGLDVFAGTLEEAQLASSSVDVITMIHVIEHVPDPTAVLGEVHRVLKQEGCFVLETPRYDSLVFRLLGKRERSISCDGHIYFFTRSALEQMAIKAGFKVLRNDSVGRSMTLDRLTYNLGVISKSTAVQQGLAFLSRKVGLNKASVSLNMRDMQRLYLQKV